MKEHAERFFVHSPMHFLRADYQACDRLIGRIPLSGVRMDRLRSSQAYDERILRALKRNSRLVRGQLDPVPLLASFAVDQLIGLVIFGEPLLFRIPVKFPTKFVTYVAKLAEGCRAVTGFDVSEGKFSRVDAVEPIVMMIPRLAKAYGRFVVLD